MSKETVCRFLEKIDEDPSFRQAMEAALEGKEDRATAATEAATAAGFEFSADELREVSDGLERTDELSDEDLEEVSGGLFAPVGTTFGIGGRFARISLRRASAVILYGVGMGDGYGD